MTTLSTPALSTLGLEKRFGSLVVASDINGDGLPDVVVGNKRGTFVHLQQLKKVSPEDWEKAQPKPVAPTSASAK